MAFLLLIGAIVASKKLSEFVDEVSKNIPKNKKSKQFPDLDD